MRASRDRLKSKRGILVTALRKTLQQHGRCLVADLGETLETGIYRFTELRLGARLFGFRRDE
jgi:hypothetical protein